MKCLPAEAAAESRAGKRVGGRAGSGGPGPSQDQAEAVEMREARGGAGKPRHCAALLRPAFDFTSGWCCSSCGVAGRCGAAATRLGAAAARPATAAAAAGITVPAA